jgi:hypothetical protein
MMHQLAPIEGEIKINDRRCHLVMTKKKYLIAGGVTSG